MPGLRLHLHRPRRAPATTRRCTGSLPELVSAEARGLVHGVAVPRFAELVEGAGGRGTLFVIGGEVDARARAPLEDALRRGHELASHTFGHDYALSRAPPRDIDRDLARAAGGPPLAGRSRGRSGSAPRATRSPRPCSARVVGRGYAYDASIFPAAPYWAAKALTLGWLQVRGRRSAAILDSPRVLLAPRLPYRPDPDRPERRGTAPAARAADVGDPRGADPVHRHLRRARAVADRARGVRPAPRASPSSRSSCTRWTCSARRTGSRGAHPSAAGPRPAAVDQAQPTPAGPGVAGPGLPAGAAPGGRAVAGRDGPGAGG